MNPNNLTTLLVQNPNLMLSCGAPDLQMMQADSAMIDHGYASAVAATATTTIIPELSTHRQFSLDQFIQQEEVPFEQQEAIKEEILGALF